MVSLDVCWLLRRYTIALKMKHRDFFFINYKLIPKLKIISQRKKQKKKLKITSTIVEKETKDRIHLVVGAVCPFIFALNNYILTK